MSSMILQVDSSEDIPEFINYTKCNPVSTDNGFLVSVQSSSLMLWVEDNKVVLDTGHGLPITTVCVSASSNPYICSCSDDKVILWSLEDFSSNHGSGRTPNSGLLVGVELGSISDCSISCDNSWLALCRESDVLIVHLQHTDGVLNAVSHHATLESPGEAPSFCCFSPIVAKLLVTADDSNAFKVWDTQLGHVVHHAALGGWHRISFCEFVLRGSHQGHLLVGSNRGVLHIFSVSISKPPRSLGHVSATPPLRSSVSLTVDNLGVGANTEKHVKSGNDHTSRLPATPPGQIDGCEACSVILGALLLDAYPECAAPPSPEETPSALLPDEADPVVDGILAAAPLLAVCSNLGIAVYDCNTEACLDFRPYADLLGTEPSLVSTAALAGRSPGRIACLVGSLVGCGPRTHLVHLACCPREHRPHASGISFLNLSSLTPRSPLRAQFARPAVDSATAAYGKGAAASSSSRASASRASAPRTAAPPPRAVRSSGYGAGQRQLFPTNKRRPRGPPVLPKAGLWGGDSPGGSAGLLSGVDADLMRSWTPPLQQCSKVSLWNDFGTAVRLAASGDGASLACSCGPGVISVLRWPRPSVEDGVRITGHDSRITSIDFSADSKWLMSSSGDGSTKVWGWRERRCLLDIGDAAKPCDKAEGAARGPAVAQASFFYMDRFILRAVANYVDLYCHRLQEQAEVPRVGGPRGWRRVRRIKLPTQQATCFVAPNTFYSNLLVVGCASRSLHAYDVDAERFLVEVRDAHARAPHTLALATASATVPQSGRAVDLVVSAAACDGAKMWDLRQARCVQKYSRHSNRAHSCGVALSACCRYLAVGSEDKCVYLYDTRKSSDYVDRLLGLNDVVLDVVWNPRRPQLAASALNSCVAVYGCVGGN